MSGMSHNFEVFSRTDLSIFPPIASSEDGERTWRRGNLKDGSALMKSKDLNLPLGN
jgi:hypothetical protein